MNMSRLQPPTSRLPTLTLCLALGLVLFTCIAATAQVVANPYLAVPRFQNQSTDEFLYFDLADGRGRLADRLRVPTELRSRLLSANLFRVYGRTTQPVFGDLHLAPIFDSGGTVRSALFVEASTGYMAYVEDLAKGGDLGQLKTVIGRPFGTIRGGDGNYALLPLRGRNGATRGAYLYHGLDGATLYVDDIGDLRNDPPVSTATSLPPAEGWVSTAELLSDEQTAAFLLLDNAAGRAHRIDVSQVQPQRLASRTFDLDFNQAFAADAYNPAPTRFVTVPLNSAGPSTVRVLVIDTSTGKLAYLEGLEGSSPRLAFLSQNLYQVLRPGIGDVTRMLTPVPRQDTSGRTLGLWLIDSLSGSLLYLDNVNDPAQLSISPVRPER